MTNNNTVPTQTGTDAADRTYIMERVFDAPRALVFEAYSSAEHLKNWWGPKGWTLPVCEVDFRPGGTWLYCMKGPAEANHMESWGKAIYREIVAPERLVYTDMFVDSEGNQLPNTPTLEITVHFEEIDGKTKLISQTLFDSAEALQAVLKMGMEQGFSETLDRLESYLETME